MEFEDLDSLLPEPRKYVWGSVKFLEWFKKNECASPLKKDDLLTCEMFLLPQMSELKEYLTKVTASVPFVHNYSHEYITLSAANMNNFAKDKGYLIGCDTCICENHLNYFLDRYSGKVVREACECGDRESNRKIIAESFKEYILEHIHRSMIDSWKWKTRIRVYRHPMFPGLNIVNNNVLRAMTELTTGNSTGLTFSL